LECGDSSPLLARSRRYEVARGSDILRPKLLERAAEEGVDIAGDFVAGGAPAGGGEVVVFFGEDLGDEFAKSLPTANIFMA
jgi:hypothetical protein